MTRRGYFRLLALGLAVTLISGLGSLLALGWLSHSISGKHRGELLSVLDTLAARLMLDVFADDRIAHASAPVAELPELVVGGLPLTVGRHPCIDCSTV